MGGRGQSTHFLLDTITLGSIGFGTSEPISSSFLATPSGLENQGMVVESKPRVGAVSDLAPQRSTAMMLIQRAFSY